MHDTIRTRMPRFGTATTLAAVAALATVALAGCAPAAPAAPVETDDHAPAASHQHYFVSDAWVQAAEGESTGAFGVIESQGHHEVTLVGASTPAAGAVELHEAVPGAFTIPAEERLTLEPGGSYLELVDLTAPIVAGDEIEFTLTFSDDEVVTFTAIAKD